MAHVRDAVLSKPTHFNFAEDVIDHWANKLPKLEALYWLSGDMTVSQTFTYSHIATQSHRIASLFQSLGVQPGEKVVLICPRLPQWWEVAVACLRLSVVLCPATTLLVDKEIQYRCQKTNATVFVGNTDSIAKFRRVQGQCPSVKHVLQLGNGGTFPTLEVIQLKNALKEIPLDRKVKSSQSKSDDPALIYFTSGTSGPPKMVQHTHASYPLAHALTGKHWLQLSPGNVYWNLAEQGWGKAAWSMFGAWNCGATLFVFDDRSTFSATKMTHILSNFPIQTLCAPPTVYRHLVLQQHNPEFVSSQPFNKLTHCVSAGEALNNEVIRQWHKMTNIVIREGYGQTETTLLCGNFEGTPTRPGSMGKPVPGVPLSVVDSFGNECVAGVEGDIALILSDGDKASPFFGFFDGYLGDDGECVAPIRTSERRSWYSTGDRAFKDTGGYFWFVGRADDVINASGYRIGPFEVESVLAAHQGIVESAVVCSPDPIRGEVVKAFIVLTTEWAERASKDADGVVKDVQAFCKKNAAPYKYPRKVQFVTGSFLPKTISGKIRRRELRDMEWGLGPKINGKPQKMRSPEVIPKMQRSTVVA
ncbi:acetyl-CoA synthetase [Lophiotrema nucula]|uniref:medium-chain acyl-CoA ligase n=1 Tax=Lophiotrema nucula TaxID=690887 RepID=A0A6A5YJF7_9PLEO|nr:acetyl-CoA synthetase [Lophiotrema nucula]